MGADTGELQAWIADLERAEEQLLERVERVIGRGCNNIKKDWKARWTGFPHIPHLPNAISYDVVRHGDTVSGEVGVDVRRRQGPLGGIIAWGLGPNAPLPGPLEAVAAEEPRLQKALADLMEELLGDES